MPDWGRLFELRHKGIKNYISKVAKLHGKPKDPKDGVGVWDFDKDVGKYLKEMKEVHIDNWSQSGWIGPIRECEWSDILKYNAEMRRKIYGNPENLHKMKQKEAKMEKKKDQKLEEILNKKKQEEAYSYYNLGNEYLDKGEYDKAIDMFSKFIKIKPKESAESYYNRGNAYLGKNEYDKAIGDYNKAIKMYPENEDAYNNRGLAYLRKGDIKKAIIDFNKFIELDPNNIYGLENLSIAYEEIGDSEKAKIFKEKYLLAKKSKDHKHERI